MRAAAFGLVLILVASATAQEKVVVVDPQTLRFNPTVILPKSNADAEKQAWWDDLRARYDGKQIEVKGILGGPAPAGHMMLKVIIPSLEGRPKDHAPVYLTWDDNEVVKTDRMNKELTITGTGKVKKGELQLYVERAKFKRN